MGIIEELNRRGVIRAAALYVAIAWGGTEILVFLIDALQGEQVAGPFRKYLAILFIAGFPVAMRFMCFKRAVANAVRRNSLIRLHPFRSTDRPRRPPVFYRSPAIA